MNGGVLNDSAFIACSLHSQSMIFSYTSRSSPGSIEWISRFSSLFPCSPALVQQIVMVIPKCLLTEGSTSHTRRCLSLEKCYSLVSNANLSKSHICETTPGVNSFSGYVHLPSTLLAETQDPSDPYNISTFFWYFEVVIPDCP